jgi:predicted transglutaminase-like cysteine proteinase
MHLARALYAPDGGLLMLRRHCFALIIAAATLAPAAAQAQTAAPVAAPPAAAPVDKSQEIICKREKETGSLVKAKRTCLTRQQWAYVQDTNQQFARELNNSTMSRPGSQ